MPSWTNNSIAVVQSNKFSTIATRWGCNHALLSADKMRRADKAILRRMPVLPVDGGNPASTAIGVDRETVERERASFSQAVHASMSTTTLHHDYRFCHP